MTTKKTTKTKKVEKPVRLPDATVSLQKGLIGVSMSMTDGVLKMETTPDQAVKSIKDARDFIDLLIDAVAEIDEMTTEDLCCNETDNEEVCVGPCYCSQN